MQKDFEVRELREFNKNVTKQIGESVHQNPDMAQAVHLYFSQADLPPPPTQGMYVEAFEALHSRFSLYNSRKKWKDLSISSRTRFRTRFRQKQCLFITNVQCPF